MNILEIVVAEIKRDKFFDKCTIDTRSSMSTFVCQLLQAKHPTIKHNCVTLIRCISDDSLLIIDEHGTTKFDIADPTTSLEIIIENIKNRL